MHVTLNLKSIVYTIRSNILFRISSTKKRFRVILDLIQIEIREWTFLAYALVYGVYTSYSMHFKSWVQFEMKI